MRYLVGLRRASVLCVLAVLASLALTANCVAERKGDVSISIHASPSEATSGTQIKLFVSVKNMSDSFISVRRPDPGHAEDMVNIDIFGANGNKLKCIDFHTHTITVNGKRITVHEYFAGSSPFLDPGKTWTAYTILNNLFDITKPEKYRVSANNVWVSAWGPSDGKSGSKLVDVKSNIITITVTPKS